MKKLAFKKLQNYCDDLTIDEQRVNSSVTIVCYFEFEYDGYYATMFYDNNTWDAVFDVYPAMDDIVTSDEPIYHKELDMDINQDNFKSCIYNFLKEIYYKNK